MAKLKVGVCCTFGAGSSMMLKMNLDTTFQKLGIDATVEVYDISGIKGVDLDAIVGSGDQDHRRACSKLLRFPGLRGTRQ
jgi:galactitol-specific phosphotransferase system IIB component